MTPSTPKPIRSRGDAPADERTSGLTRRQRLVLETISDIVAARGYPPSMREIGDAVGLTPTVTFLSLVFWAAIAGPLGAILAVPLTLAFKAFLVDADPRMTWLATFLTTPDADAKRGKKRARKLSLSRS